MIISNLDHLAVVSEASNIVGGSGKKKGNNAPKKPSSPKYNSFFLKIQSNVSVIDQNAEANSAAVSNGKYSDASSKAVAENKATVTQSNS